MVIMASKSKRSRSANWDQLEKALLKKCIKKHMAIIECKSCDTNTNKAKQLAWKQVLQRFMEVNTRERTMAEMRQQWRTLKLEAKRNASEYKQSLKQTGSGMKPPSPDLNTQEIMNMIPQEFEEQTNLFDSDSIILTVERDPIGIINKEQESVIMIKEEMITPNSDNQEDQIDVAERKKTLERVSIGGEGSIWKVERDPTGTINDEQESDRMSPNTDQIPFTPASIPQEHEIKIPRVLQYKRTSQGKKKVESRSMPERDIVLIKCLKEESRLKMQQMTEAHQWAREEHVLKIEQLKLKNILLEKQIYGNDRL